MRRHTQRLVTAGDAPARGVPAVIRRGRFASVLIHTALAAVVIWRASHRAQARLSVTMPHGALSRVTLVPFGKIADELSNALHSFSQNLIGSFLGNHVD
jgi:hypothetical protein